MKRDWKTRVVRWLAKTRPIACLLFFCAPISLFGQEAPPEPKLNPTPASASASHLADLARDSPSVKIQPGKIIKAEVDLALVNVTVTDPYN
ncbi:MAG: hypothetical protein WBQ89_21365, partial [Candidatus Acidiferrum sp.]